MMIRPIAQIFFFILFYFPFYVGTKPTTVRIFDGEESYFEPKYARSCLEYRTHYVAKSHSYANAHHLFLNIIFYIHHSAWRRGFGVLIVNQPLQNKLILQVLLFLCHCNALTDIKWTYREIMLELKIAAYILRNLHTVRLLNSQIRIQAFALGTEPNISTRSSQSWAISGQLLISAFHGPLHWLSSPIFPCLSFVPLWWHPTKSSLVFNIYRHKSPLH